MYFFVDKIQRLRSQVESRKRTTWLSNLPDESGRQALETRDEASRLSCALIHLALATRGARVDAGLEAHALKQPDGVFGGDVAARTGA